MKAKVGDRLVLESAQLGKPRRIGIIVGLHHADGSPPYDVRWLDQEHPTMVFPGPDARVEHHQDVPAKSS
ncbi:hypothetical protein Sru01_16690 [Sphaerisporangium rufum]|uniref:DUF1918 domain-containing protein n=1 Tax=Sphaerisporangium rufum TaxID=1381558 RepID=A0A919R440_9ACTN|nr:DUF1918 domain-containing protein [Sphaerisporangium rufum]GII76687.1 hypothetical protein Sru01_16690 [Sphaerisporangium rufum]